MKKLMVLLLAALMLVFPLVSCTEAVVNDPDETATEPVVTTPAPPETGATTPPPTIDTTPGGDTVVTTVSLIDTWDRGEGVINTQKYSPMPATSTYKNYDYIATYSDLIARFSTAGDTYNGFTPSYFTRIKSEGEFKAATEAEVKASKSACFVTFENENRTGKKVDVYIDLYPFVAHPSYTSIKAEQSSVLQITFTTNVVANFSASISESDKPKTTGSQVKAEADKLVCSYITNQPSLGNTARYTVTFYLTVPQSDADMYGAGFYVHLYAETGSSITPVTSVPLTITKAKYLAPYKLILTRDWGIVRNGNTANGSTDGKFIGREYIDNIVHLFYDTYPRLIARWGAYNGGNTNADKDTGVNVKETIVILFQCSRDYDGAARTASNWVEVGFDHAVGNPLDIGFFSHEITHQANKYGGFEGGWWVENIATYGGHRYFHWASSNWTQLDNHSWDDMKGSTNWGAYNDKCKWFFSWMDLKFPTTKNSNGTYNWGLIDTINRGIKLKTIQGSTSQSDASNSFNKAMSAFLTQWDADHGTKYASDTWVSLRAKYETEVNKADNTGYRFGGFGNYVDNFLTEDLLNAPNPVYPMRSEYTHGTATGTREADVKIDYNSSLTKGATVIRASGQNMLKNNDVKDELASFIVDGDTTSMWNSPIIKDHLWELAGAPQFVVIDLGSKKTFNTYTTLWASYNGGASSAISNNAKVWEILISDDNKTWTSVDYQSGNNLGGATYTLTAPASARYITIKISCPMNGYQEGYDGLLKNPTGMKNYRIARMYEFLLYNV